MTEMEICERMIRAVEIADMGSHVGPSPLRAQQLPYVHSQIDMNGWGKKPGEKDQLHKEDADAHAAHRREFFDKVSASARDVSEAEAAWGWLALVEKDDHRFALASWARCMADNKRRFFKDWCRKQGISEKTGRKRKDCAVARIHAQLIRSDMQDCDSGSDEGLPDEPETGHVDGRIGQAWRPDQYPLQASSNVTEFDWAAKRNERRRQQERRKRAA